MNDLQQVQKVRVPLAGLVAAYRHFRAMGERGCEGVALWVGQIAVPEFTVTETVIPKQRGYRSDEGLLYVVEEAELRRINCWLYDHKLRMVAQLHSHPGEAYHSDTDDMYPIMTTLGGLSIVVPNFGVGMPLISDCAKYRLHETGWTELSSAEANQLIEVI